MASTSDPLAKALIVRNLISRPRILSKLDQRTNVLWDVLVTGADERGIVDGLSLKDLEEMIHLSRPALVRTINRLVGLRLLIKQSTGRGRGAFTRYIIRPMYAIWCRIRKSLYYGVSRLKKSFPQVKGTPHAFSNVPQRDKSFPKDARARSPGHAMAIARRAAEKNRYLSAEDRALFVSCLGRLLFREGRFQELNSGSTLHDLLVALAKWRPDYAAGRPSRRRRFAAIHDWIVSFIDPAEVDRRRKIRRLDYRMRRLWEWATTSKLNRDLAALYHSTQWEIVKLVEALRPTPAEWRMLNGKWWADALEA